MAESNTTPNNNIFSENDPLDINELASLNEEISTDFIEQLQNQIAASANVKNDGDLFEEPEEKELPNSQQLTEKTEPINNELPESKLLEDISQLEDKKESNEQVSVTAESTQDIETKQIDKTDLKVVDEKNTEPKENIETVSGGNITEKPITKENVEYSKSLDYIDDNVNYSKYVIYIDPENKDFIDSLTVKERKNIINRILKEQDSVAVTKRKLAKMQTVITHLIVAVLTVVISIPCIYWAINASLEATINNYRASQSNFGQLYREHGKIKTQSNLK